jgi:A/G-specific adenine glycosylase
LYPRKEPKKQRPHRHGFAYWLEHDRHVLLVRRPARGLLGGMLALPSGPWGERAIAEPPADLVWTSAGAVEHGFTHFTLSLHVLRATAPQRSADGTWWPTERIGEAGLPTLFARAAERALAAGEVKRAA